MVSHAQCGGALTGFCLDFLSVQMLLFSISFVFVLFFCYYLLFSFVVAPYFVLIVFLFINLYRYSFLLKAKKIFLAFMKKHKDSNLLLDVLGNNKRAIKFYKKNGFKKIADTKFGKKMKGIVMLKITKKNRTRKNKN